MDWQYRSCCGTAIVMSESVVKQIQADALEHATQLLTVNGDSPDRGFNAVYRLMLELQNAEASNSQSPSSAQVAELLEHCHSAMIAACEEVTSPELAIALKERARRCRRMIQELTPLPSREGE